jgi:CubicO group peptidase (beta-lactamase class C family)
MRGGPAGGCYSTVEDLLKFEMALYSNKIISEKMRLFVMSPKPELNSPSYGYGFQIFDDVHAVGHTGGFKGITTSMKIYEKSGYVAIVLSNLFPSHPGPSNLIAEKISELVNR